MKKSIRLRRPEYHLLTINKTALAFVLGLIILAPQAHGISFTLSDSFCATSCGAGPFGHVDLTQIDAKTVGISVTLAPGETFVRNAEGEMLYLNTKRWPKDSYQDGPMDGWPDSFQLEGLGFNGGHPAEPDSVLGVMEPVLGSFDYFFCFEGPSAYISSEHIFFKALRNSGLDVADFVKSTGGTAGGLYFAVHIRAANGTIGFVGAPGPGE